MNKRTEFVGGLRQLATNIKAIEFYRMAFVWAGRRAMNEGRTFSEADEHRDVKFWRQFKDDIVVELNTAVRIGLQHFESDLASCRKLSIELSQGFYKEGSPLIFESITEVTALADKLEYSTSEEESKGSKDTIAIDEKLDRAVELWNANDEMTKKELELAIEEGNYNHLSFFNSVKAYSDKRYGEGHLRKGKRGSPRIKRE